MDGDEAIGLAYESAHYSPAAVVLASIAASIARTVAVLASDDAGFIAGTTLSINGGQMMV